MHRDIIIITIASVTLAGLVVAVAVEEVQLMVVEVIQVQVEVFKKIYLIKEHYEKGVRKIF